MFASAQERPLDLAATPDLLPELLARVEPVAHPSALAALAAEGRAAHACLVGSLRNPGPNGTPPGIDAAFGELEALTAAHRLALVALAAAAHRHPARFAASAVLARHAVPASADAAPAGDRDAAGEIQRGESSDADAPLPDLSAPALPLAAMWPAIAPLLDRPDGALAVAVELLRRRAATPPEAVDQHAALTRLTTAVRLHASAGALLEPDAWAALEPAQRAAEWRRIAPTGGPRARGGAVAALRRAAADADPDVVGLVALTVGVGGGGEREALALLERLAAHPDAGAAARARLALDAQAAERAWRVAGEIDAIRAGLASADPSRVTAAFDAIRRLGADAAVLAAPVLDAVIAAVAARGPTDATVLLHAAAAIGAPIAALAAERLGDPDRSVRHAAARLLAQVDSIPADAVGPLATAAFAEPDAAVRAAAEQALFRLSPGVALAPLLAAVAGSATRGEALRALERLTMQAEWRDALGPGSGPLVALVAGGDLDAASRERAIRLLGRTSALPAGLAPLLDADDPAVRHGVLGLLAAGRPGSGELLGVVAERAADAVEAVRVAAIGAIAGVDAPAADRAAALAARLGGFTAVAERCAAATAIARIGPLGTAPERAATFDRELAAWADGAPSELVLAIDVARLALGEAGAAAARAALTRRLTDPAVDADARLATLRAVPAAGPHAAALTPALAELLDDADEAVATAAIFALRSIGPGAVAALPALEAYAAQHAGTVAAQRVRLALDAVRGR